MKKVQFVVDAKKYFELDADRLEKVEEGDEVLVTIDFENKKAEYTWYGNGDNPANFPSEDDDFDAVVELWQELSKYEIKRKFQIGERVSVEFGYLTGEGTVEGYFHDDVIVRLDCGEKTTIEEDFVIRI